MSQKAHITWELHGDVLVMKGNGWIRGMIYFEGGYWAVGPFDSVSSVIQPKLAFSRKKTDMKRWLAATYRSAFEQQPTGDEIASFDIQVRA